MPPACVQPFVQLANVTFAGSASVMTTAVAASFPDSDQFSVYTSVPPACTGSGASLLLSE